MKSIALSKVLKPSVLIFGYLEKSKNQNLPEELVYYLPRHHHIFQDRSISFFDMGSELRDVKAIIKIPNDLILCDCCNSCIAAEKIPLHMRIDAQTGEMYIMKAVCDKCVDKYYHEFIKIGNLTE